MPRYRDALPQLTGAPFLTDGGVETTLVFHHGLDLPCFAAFPLIEDATGRAIFDEWFRTHAEIARKHGVGFILEALTWRANPRWAAELGIEDDRLEALIRESVAMLEPVRAAFETADRPHVISCCVGPHGDGYDASERLTADDAERYHTHQIDIVRDTEADMLCAITMTYADEAIGIARAARTAGLPVAISFTVETDGRLPSGDSLADAITAVDAATDAYPAYYMINCAHPEHFADALAAPICRDRIRGLRVNASRKSHDELDNATTLDAGNPDELGGQCRDLRDLLPNLTVLGGCCGTDARHIAAIAASCCG